MARQMIVNADDFGVSPGVSRGIIQAHLEGIVTSASVMVTMPWAAEAIVVAQSEARKLGLGLHLNLTAGFPISPPEDVPDLVDSDGRFRRKADIVLALPMVDMAQVERELRAQIARFISLVGHPPDHLDSHHHITYLNPAIFSLMLRLAKEFAVPIRCPFLTDLENVIPWMLSQNGAADRRAVESLILKLRSELTDSGVRAPDHAIVNFFGDHIALGDLLLILTSIPEGVSEMMCHPGWTDDELRVSSGYTDARKMELRALTHPSAREVIESEGIELITFADLGG